MNRLRIVIALLSVIFLFPTRPIKASDEVSDVLGRTVRLNVPCGDFETENWLSECFKNDRNAANVWHPSDRGSPELLSRVETPTGGISKSKGSLEIRTNLIDSDGEPTQEDLETPYFDKISTLKRPLRRVDQPVIIVRVWLPPFDKWGQYYGFGFRHTAHINNNGANQTAYYPSIWLRCRQTQSAQLQHEANFYVRANNGTEDDVPVLSINVSGWWTLAIAFDNKGIGYYYIRQGINIPTEKDKVFDTSQFPRTKKGVANNPLMDELAYSFFSIGYNPSGNTSPSIRIDDYEVWIKNNE